MATKKKTPRKASPKELDHDTWLYRNGVGKLFKKGETPPPDYKDSP